MGCEHCDDFGAGFFVNNSGKMRTEVTTGNYGVLILWGLVLPHRWTTRQICRTTYLFMITVTIVSIFSEWWFCTNLQCEKKTLDSLLKGSHIAVGNAQASAWLGNSSLNVDKWGTVSSWVQRWKSSQLLHKNVFNCEKITEKDHYLKWI